MRRVSTKSKESDSKKRETQKAVRRVLQSRIFPLSGFQICQLYAKKMGV